MSKSGKEVFTFNSNECILFKDQDFKENEESDM
jgi:hypothetical protein